eukprot:CAMPEP_0198228410 /NCGR_PEP_ID=MMETSP1445-20131203/113034_1 /TAXON_ID=36898 /ORGANISM="Pyramimonas sp., Strain CCMP2087" /LENGTH=49 /DNA_ID=CAMNT_0043908751 /DNA_START=220 /DNA_END=369 /DNA_ORIENTATION=+
MALSPRSCAENDETTVETTGPVQCVVTGSNEQLVPDDDDDDLFGDFVSA